MTWVIKSTRDSLYLSNGISWTDDPNEAKHFNGYEKAAQYEVKYLDSRYTLRAIVLLEFAMHSFRLGKSGNDKI